MRKDSFTALWKKIDENLFTSLRNSLKLFFDKDNFLIKEWIHEQAISSKITCYLEKNLEKFLEEEWLNIDCEYNKIWKDPKEFEAIFSSIIWDDFNVFDLKWKNICKHWRIILDWDNNYVLALIEEWWDIVIWEKLNSTKIVLESKWIRPDIIIHNRGNNINNFCIFEIKKWKLDEKDILKLKWFTYKNLNFWYKYWIWLSNFKSDVVDILLYKEWKKIWEYTFKNNN